MQKLAIERYCATRQTPSSPSTRPPQKLESNVFFSPPARWGLLDFMLVARLLLPSPSFFLLLAGPHLPALDRSEPRRTSSASSWSQWASPDLICQLSIAVVLAGPHLPALGPSGPRRTSSASSWSQWASPDLHCQLSTAVGLAGPQPARVWALWASPDLNRRDLERCGPCQTSTGEILRAVGLAGPTGPKRPQTKPYRMPKRMPDRMPVK